MNMNKLANVKHIEQLYTQKRHELMHAVAATLTSFPSDVSQWQIYVTMNPRVSFEVFEYLTSPLFYCDVEDDPLANHWRTQKTRNAYGIQRLMRDYE
jgi:hypothetical protein